MHQPLKIKTCIIGNQAVGKTSILLRIHDNIFKEKMVATTGIDYNSRKEVINGEKVTVELWDTTGQDRFRNVVTNFFRGAHGIFLTFDLNSEDSLVGLQLWLKQINSVLEPHVPKILLGNKMDIKPEPTLSQMKIISKYCEENNMKFMKVSAKTSQNIKESYNMLIEQAYTYCYSKRKQKTIPVVIIDRNSKEVLSKRKCC